MGPTIELNPYNRPQAKLLGQGRFTDLSRKLAINSLIGKHQIAPRNSLIARLSELDEYERRFGFYFRGEKVWLSQSQSTPIDYFDWAWEVMLEYVFVPHPPMDPICCEKVSHSEWRLYSEFLDNILILPEITDRILPFDNIFVKLWGDSDPLNKRPCDKLVAQLFDITCNFGRILHQFFQNYSPNRWHVIRDDDCCLNEIEIFDDTEHWILSDINMYGSESSYAVFHLLAFSEWNHRIATKHRE